MARKKWPEVTITITLTPVEVEYISTVCIGRVASSALEAVPFDYEYADDLEELNTTMETLRYRMASEIFKVRVELEKQAAEPQDKITTTKWGKR